MCSSLFVRILLVAAGISLLACHSPVPRGDIAQNQLNKLSQKDEIALRATVSKHFMATATIRLKTSITEDTYANFRVLVLPKEVREIYVRKPIETLRSLKKIVEVDSAADAWTAAAYAHAAVGYANEDPVQLIIACSYTYYPTEKEFDDLNPVIPKTYRQFAIEHIDELIKDVEKQLKVKDRVPKR